MKTFRADQIYPVNNTGLVKLTYVFESVDDKLYIKIEEEHGIVKERGTGRVIPDELLK